MRKPYCLRAVAAAGRPPRPAGAPGRLRSLTWLGLLLPLALGLPRPARAQNDVMLQAFYWNVPTASATDGNWWDNLRGKAPGLKNAGFTSLWVPPPSKGNFGISDVGYGIMDHYDLGSYNQRGATETRYGSRAELDNLLTTMRGQGIQVYADIVMNHIYGGDDHSETNPAVKSYVFNESKINGTQYQNYPTGEIKWVLPAQPAGDYYVQVKGYNIPSSASADRGYELIITYGPTASGSYWWETEPNNGSGQNNVYPGSGIVMRGHSDTATDLDEYKITLTSTQDIVVRLVPKQDGSGTWLDAPATNGFYPVGVWNSAGTALAGSLQARTNTGIKNLPAKTGAGEATLTWGYEDFHPATTSDFLTADGPGTQPNVKAFGNDLNTYSTRVQTQLNAWGQWLVNTVKFDGFRLDYARGYQPEFLASWIKALPKLNNAQRFVVCEYWEDVPTTKAWVNQMSSLGTDAKAFDFPLKKTLTDLCNGDQNYSLTTLNHAGLVRSSSSALSGTSVVTFLENHDTGKEHDKWVTKDFQLGYAYILTHEGRPCVFYPQYYNVQQVDNDNSSYTVTAPASLKDDINKLMFVRRTYLGGTLAVLSETGNPYPSTDTKNVYVARRQGNGTKNGAIVVLNNHGSNTMGLWVDSSPSGYQNWAGVTLVNAFNSSQTAVVQADGRVYVSAPARGYAVWVRQSEYVAYSAPAARAASPLGLAPEAADANPLQLSLLPNPAAGAATVAYSLPAAVTTTITVQNLLGQTVRTLPARQQLAGSQSQPLPLAGLAAGTYLVRLQAGDATQTTRLVVE